MNLLKMKNSITPSNLNLMPLQPIIEEGTENILNQNKNFFINEMNEKEENKKIKNKLNHHY